MRDPRHPRWASAASWLLPTRYRNEILDDLFEERLTMIDRGRSRMVAGSWLFAHILRSAVAGRRGDIGDGREPVARADAGRGTSMSASLIQDTRYALRSLARRPRSIAGTAGLLALAIGLATAMFTVVDALMLRPVPFKDPDALASLYLYGITGDTLTAWKASPLFTGVEAASYEAALVTTDAGDFKKTVALVTPGIFDLLGGVRPIRGRLFDAEDGRPDRADRALVSEDVWRTLYGSDPMLVGRTILIESQPFVIVGILPRSFQFPRRNIAVWRAKQFGPAERAIGPYVRFAPGIPRDEALRVARSLANAVKPLQPDDRIAAYALGADLKPFYAKAIPFLSGGVALLFVVLCANAASLRLTNLAARAREFGTLTALGASRARLIRQTMIECALISAAGCLGGLALAWVLIALARTGLPAAAMAHSLAPLAIDARAMLVTSMAGLLALLGVGLVPALTSTRLQVSDLLAAGRGGTDPPRVRRATRVLLIGQFALSCTLVLGAALLARSFVSLVNADRGFDPGNVLVADFDLRAKTLTTPDARNAVAQTIENAARALPGIRNVAWTYGTPPYGGSISTPEWLTDTPGAAPITMRVYSFSVGADFFNTFGVPILRGGTFESSDPASLLISERVAHKLWPGQDAVGQHVRVVEGKQAGTLRVAGVVRDLYFPSVDPEADAPQIYMQYRAGGARRMLSLRCDGPCPNPASVWRQLAGVHPAVEVVGVTALDSTYTAEFVGPRAASVLVLVFAVTALLASAAGLFSLLNDSVARRRREFGIRAALGATPAEVRRLVWREGLSVALGGTALGWLGGLWLSRALTSFLFQTSPLDPVSLVVVTVVLACAVAAASWMPVRGAGKLSPVQLLREE